MKLRTQPAMSMYLCRVLKSVVSEPNRKLKYYSEKLWKLQTIWARPKQTYSTWGPVHCSVVFLIPKTLIKSADLFLAHKNLNTVTDKTYNEKY